MADFNNPFGTLQYVPPAEMGEAFRQAAQGDDDEQKRREEAMRKAKLEALRRMASLSPNNSPISNPQTTRY